MYSDCIQLRKRLRIIDGKILKIMAFNFSNLGQQTLENLLFQSIANGVVIPTQSNFVNQLTATPATNNSSLSNHLGKSKNQSGIIPTTTSDDVVKSTNATRLCSSLVANNIIPNKGTAPMDLDNDLDTEQTFPITTITSLTESIAAATTMVTSTTQSKILASSNNNMIMSIPEAHMYLNGLMANNIAMNSSLVYFPTTTSNNNATTASTSDNFNDNMPTKMTTKVKEIIKTKNCILLPPNPNAPPPTIRERPPGCRTVFVGGLPENITEGILREIFNRCGEITTLRMSKKNFCHIRFRYEDSIDQAIFLSGYRIRLDTATNEPANYGRLHVDYAQARDDQYDYECRQRQLQREQRHRDRHNSHDRSNSKSPLTLTHYSDHEATIIADHLRNNETFVKAIQTITNWLERGDCNKRNANVFYSMIQSTHSHVRRLTGDKQLFEEELRKAREIYRKQMLIMASQFTQIEKMFNAASHKKVWDHFTKAQRKNIDQWKKLVTELRSTQIDDEDLDMSDDNYHGHNNNQSHIHDLSTIKSVKRKRYEHLKEENDSLRCQLEAVRNEMSLERTDIRCNSEFREKQIKVLQETIRNMQTQLLQTKMREQKDNKTIEQLEKRLKEAAVKQLLLKTKIRETIERVKEVKEAKEHVTVTTTSNNMNHKHNEIIDIDVDKSDDEVKIIEESHDQTKCNKILHEIELNQSENENIEDNEFESSVPPTTQSLISSDESHFNNEMSKIEMKKLHLDDAKLLALSAAFLILQPRGCTTAAICSYINNVTDNSSLEYKQLNSLLENYQNMFYKSDDNIKNDSTIWKFCGFVSPQTTSR